MQRFCRIRQFIAADQVQSNYFVVDTEEELKTWWIKLQENRQRNQAKDRHQSRTFDIGFLFQQTWLVKLNSLLSAPNQDGVAGVRQILKGKTAIYETTMTENQGRTQWLREYANLTHTTNLESYELSLKCTLPYRRGYKYFEVDNKLKTLFSKILNILKASYTFNKDC